MSETSEVTVYSASPECNLRWMEFARPGQPLEKYFLNSETFIVNCHLHPDADPSYSARFLAWNMKGVMKVGLSNATIAPTKRTIVVPPGRPIWTMILKWIERRLQ